VSDSTVRAAAAASPSDASGASKTSEPGGPTRAAVVLCGGHSRRMGRDKAWLPFGEVTLLERVVGRVAPLVDECVVVARAGQQVPGGFDVVRDPPGGEGPLAGIVSGLASVRAERVFVTACDAPLLVPAVVERLFSLSADVDVVVPRIGRHHMVLTAVYARSLLPSAEALLAARRLRPFYLLEHARVRIIGEDDLRDVDPDLDSLRDCDTPEAYEDALKRAGFAAPSRA
jgi:molybdopterin-guanine dinucleotide biosynthesis protein A